MKTLLLSLMILLAGTAQSQEETFRTYKNAINNTTDCDTVYFNTGEKALYRVLFVGAAFVDVTKCGDQERTRLRKKDFFKIVYANGRVLRISFQERAFDRKRIDTIFYTDGSKRLAYIFDRGVKDILVYEKLSDGMTQRDTIVRTDISKIHFGTREIEVIGGKEDEQQKQKKLGGVFLSFGGGYGEMMRRGAGATHIHKTLEPAASISVGYKYYFYANSWKSLPGIQIGSRLNFDLSINTTTRISHFLGYTHLFNVSDRFGVELNLNGGVSIDLNANAGWVINPELKFRFKKFTLGAEYNFMKAFKDKNMNRQLLQASQVGLSVGVQF